MAKISGLWQMGILIETGGGIHTGGYLRRFILKKNRRNAGKQSDGWFQFSDRGYCAFVR